MPVVISYMNKLVYSIIFLAATLAGCSQKHPAAALADDILADTTLLTVDSMARAVLAQGFNAGSGYSQVWARDLNTFIETACEVNDPADVRGALELFFALQQPNGEMIDGYVLKEDFNWGDEHPYYSDAAPRHVAFKNTVETDQETSLIQAVSKYVAYTGDTAFLSDTVAGHTVLERMDMMIEYLLAERYDKEHGLIWGALTADWGDVQAFDMELVDITDSTTRTIDMYDNAMLVIALDRLNSIAPEAPNAGRWKDLRDSVADRARRYLWDVDRQKVRPHVYIDPSPFPAGFNEDEIHYHGGTAIAIEAGLLSNDEIAAVNQQMLKNVEESGMSSIGLTLYPTYPTGTFRGSMDQPYVYQNGGDWTWFGGRMIQQLINAGMTQEAYDEIRPMIDRVIANKGFYEWYGQGEVPSGSGHFKGSAGVLAKAIGMLRQWADEQKNQN